MRILRDCHNPSLKSGKSGRVLTHLLDTDICIFIMKGRDLALGRRLDTFAQQSAVSDVSLFELYSGAERYDFPLKRIRVIDEFAARLTVLTFNTKVARIAGKIRFHLERAGQMIGGYDVLIAATALSENLTLVTNNLREFNRVEGLVLEKWV